MKVAIYARFSSDLQNPASVDDQIRICQEHADKEGWQVLDPYVDRAISGASMMLRPGIQKLMRDASSGEFDIVLLEALDRLSRDQEDTAGLYKRLTFHGVKIISLSEGEITSLHVGFKGTMNALFLKDMANKVRRGQRGRVEKGKVAGGLCYGYDVVRKLDERGEPIRGERKINEEQARIVRRIFEEYAAGKSPRAIARDLNADGIPGPSGKGWGDTTIYGNWQRGSGILNNDIYNGALVWNKVSYPKNPGKHVTRNNPPEEWIRNPVPGLRIVDPQIWDKAKARQKRLRRSPKDFWRNQRPRNLFSYLLKCGECGGGMSKISSNHYGCSTARNKGTSICSNVRTIRQDALQHTVLSLLQDKLMNPSLVKVFCEEYTAHLNRCRMEQNASLSAYRAELDKIAQKDKRIVQAIMDGYASETLKEEMNLLVARKAELEELIAGTHEAPVLLHPRMADRYREEVLRLVEALNDDDKRRREAIELIRALIDKVVLVPDPDSENLLIDLYGDLAGILNVSLGRANASAKNGLDPKQVRLVVGLNTSSSGVQDKMVGPAGLEPATRRL